MITNILSKFQTYWDNAKLKSQATKLQNTLPIILANKLIDGYWEGNEAVTKDFSKKFVREMSQRMMEEILIVIQSEDPALANREKLASYAIECSKYQVLVLTPDPKDDVTGMVGRCGISGMLKERILDVIKTDKALIQVFHGLPDDLSFNDAWDVILMKYRISWAFMSVFAGMRGCFKDSNPVDSKDWFRPFFTSMCAWEEATFRNALGMANLLEDDLDSKFTINALAYSTFLDFVMRGDVYPDLTWEQTYPDLENPRSPS